MPTPITDPDQIHVKHSDTDVWINPVGGLGDMLMLSSVLKIVHDQNPDKKFRLVRRTRYPLFLRNHPAIEYIGYPPKGTKNIITPNYWDKWPMGGGKDRAFQRLAAIFGLETPVEENLWVPFEIKPDTFLDKAIPWEKKNILIAPFSDSPRKMMPPEKWEELVYMLRDEGYFVIQTGQKHEFVIKGAYSLLGATDPKQLLSLVKRCSAVVTSDSFIMHAAKLIGTPAYVVWGPTQRIVYGYDNHTHFEASLDHCDQADKCLGPHVPENYNTTCPLEKEHCMAKIDINKIIRSITSKI